MVSRHLVTTTAFLTSVILLVLAMWTWSSANAANGYSAHPEATMWAARCFALAAASAAELIVLVFVVGSIFPKRVIDEIVRAGAALTCSITFVSAIALKLAGS